MDQRSDDPAVPSTADAAAPLPQQCPQPLPQPPAHHVAPNTRHRRRRHHRPGDLTPGWGTVFGSAWLLVAVGFASVWVSSRTTGLSTWWLGPETEPRFFVLWLLPFVAPLVLAASGYSQVRHLPHAGLVGALATALIATGDLGRVNGYAAIEFALAGGGLLVSLASFGGRYRAASPVSSDAAPGESATAV